MSTVKQRIALVVKPLARPPSAIPPTDDPSFPLHRRRVVAAEEHAASVAAVRTLLEARGAEVRVAEGPDDVRGVDLIVSVGGDGTFLTAARYAEREPLLGVNSSPSTSVGHYCAATSDTLGEWLDRVGAGDAPTPLIRIATSVGGRALPFVALNDVLFANRSPVASTRYAIGRKDDLELQLSSGVWIATPSGSTAAIRSAGGDVMAPGDRRLQFRIREPYQPPDGPYEVLGGYTDRLDIVSRSDRNAVFLDGHVDVFTAALGARVTLSVAPDPLLVYGYTGPTTEPA